MKIKNICGLEWIYLGTDEQKREKYLLKDVLDEEHIKRYADDEFMVNSSGVRHQDHIRSFEWDKSYIKNVILENFKKDLNIDCEFDLLSKDEVEQLDDEVRICNDWYWTKTPWTSNSSYVWFVHANGHVSYTDANYTSNGVRPVLYMKSNKIDKVSTQTASPKAERIEDSIITINKNIEKLTKAVNMLIERVYSDDK